MASIMECCGNGIASTIRHGYQICYAALFERLVDVLLPG
jgi:hypothetical protein